LPQSALVSPNELDEGIRRVSFPLQHVLYVLLVCAGYYGGALIGQSLKFPDSHLSLIWPPTAILLAALLLAPSGQWWVFLLAVAPVHIIVQLKDGVPLLGILSQLIGNFGQALLAAISVRYFVKGRLQLDTFRTLTIFVLGAVIFGPFLISSIAAYLYVLSGWEHEYWYVWRARVLSNALSTLTIIPPILMVFAGESAKPYCPARWRFIELGLLVAGLILAGSTAFGNQAAVPALLYAPLPFLLLAAVRFEVGILSLSLLLTAYLAFLSTSKGWGPFATQSAAETALSLQLFLITVFLPLMFLAAMSSERRERENALRDSEARYRALVMASASMVWRATANGEGFLVCPRWQELTGQSEQDANNFGWLSALHPKDQERSAQLWKQSMAQKRMYEDEFQICTRDQSYRHLHVQAVPIIAPNGAVHEWIGAAVDITQEKEIASTVQRQRDELAHVVRINTIGELAASLAHELNQPLTAILSNAQAAQRFLAADPTSLGEVRAILQDIVDDDRRAGEIIRRVRELVKKGNFEIGPLDLETILREVLMLIHSDAILHNVDIVLQVDPGARRIYGDKVQLQQVLLNLLLNAFQAMKACPMNERQVSVRTTPNKDHNVMIAVRDCGQGLKSDQLDKIFQPFYTTKDNGLGLGLAISRSIVEAHGGRLWAQNNPHRGAIICFTVPLCEEGI
jgi:two-component system, LuxR family, sensor kinase FixL